jgi:cytoskeletal protein RodZ
MVGARSTLPARDRSAGEALRTARRRQKLGLNEIAVALRIPPVQLKSLEEGNFSVFAAEVYARGAYRKYARYLGVERRQVHHAFLRSLSGARELVPLRLPQTSSWLQRVWTPAGVVVLSIAGGVLLVASYLAWQVQTFVRLPALELTEPSAVVLAQASVTVRGRTEAEAQVQVNGEAVLPGDDGVFSFELPLRPGINVVRATATGAAGRARVVERRLLVPRS